MGRRHEFYNYESLQQNLVSSWKKPNVCSGDKKSGKYSCIFWKRMTSLMRSSLVVRASDCQCRSRNSPGFDPSILPHSGIWGAAYKAVLNTVHRKKEKKSLKIPLLICLGLNLKNPPVNLSGFYRERPCYNGSQVTLGQNQVTALKESMWI